MSNYTSIIMAIKEHIKKISLVLSLQCQVPCLHIMDPNWLSISLYLCPGKLLDRAFSPSMHCNEARQVCVRMSSSEVSVASRMGSNDLRLSLTLNPPPCPQNMAHLFTAALIHPNRLRFRFPRTWLSTKTKTKR